MPLKTLSLSEQIAQHLTQKIVTGEFAPGSRLPENELAKTLEVSTNSLREAFRLMENMHLVELQPRRGVRVCDVNPQQVRDLYDFLFLLLSRLAAQVAEAWQEGEVEDLIDMVGELGKHFQDNNLQQAHEAAFRFMQIATRRFAKNPYLARDIEGLLPQLQRYSYIALRAETTEFDVSLSIFQRLVKNVLARDASATVADIREYGENQCQIVLRALAQQNAA